MFINYMNERLGPPIRENHVSTDNNSDTLIELEAEPNYNINENKEEGEGEGEEKEEVVEVVEEEVVEEEEEDSIRDKNVKAVTILLSEFYDGGPLFICPGQGRRR